MMEENRTMQKYGDIINLPHPTSKKHPRMAPIDRAAQFSPFAALTGYETALQETLELAVDRVEHEVETEAFLEETDIF